MKNKIDIYTKDRHYIIKTNDEDFNKGNIFTSRKSINFADLSFLQEVEYEDHNDSGGGVTKDVEYIRLNAQEISSIFIDDIDINQAMINKAKWRGYKTKFPLLYHVQVFKDNFVYNWYPTTGSTTKQNTEFKHSSESLGYFQTFDDLLFYIDNVPSLPTPSKNN